MEIPLYSEDLINKLPKLFPPINLTKNGTPNFDVTLQEIWFEEGKQWVIKRLEESLKQQLKESK